MSPDVASIDPPISLQRRLKLIHRYLTPTVLLAMLLGILLGMVDPPTAASCEPIAKGFITAVKWFVYPLVFFTITLGVASVATLGTVGRLGLKALLYFEIITTLALVIGIVVASCWQPGRGILPTTDRSTLPASAKGLEVAKQVAPEAGGKLLAIWHFLRDNGTLQVLLVSLLLGIGIQQIPGNQALLTRLQQGMRWTFLGLSLLMLAAPLGAFGGMAATVGKYGIAALWPLAQLMLCVYTTMALFVGGVLTPVVRRAGVRMFDLLRYLKEELLLVLGTSSSESALPALMTKLQEMGCRPAVVGLVVPTGYSFNLDGTSIYLSMAVLFLAQVYQVTLSWTQIGIILATLMITSKGAAGVTGSGMVVLASTLAALKVIPLEGIAMLLGVDRFMSEARSITNLIGNAVATIYLADCEQALDHDAWEAIRREKGWSKGSP
ncbi:MAG: cation:dicarboxylate symporter family transporter [Pirellulaceae bacterium]|jgi:aerobic C4-dicarboxylate transport protein